MAAAIERRRRNNQNRGIDEEREHERERRVDRRELDRFPFAAWIEFVVARLHDRGMQIEIVWHHRRAEDADRYIEHLGIDQDLWRWEKAFGDSNDVRPGKNNFQPEADADCADERDDQCLGVAKTFVLKQEDYQHIERGDADPPDEGNAKE